MIIMMEKFFEINRLLDFYGSLLTEKQQKAIAMYYIYDCSINEIADELSISKQAVSDNLKRAEYNLRQFEAKLKLMELSFQREEDDRKKRERLKSLFQLLENTSKELNQDVLSEIKTMIFTNEEVY